MENETKLISISSIGEIFKGLEKCLQREVGFEIEQLEGVLRVRTPFLYRNNDYIELFISLTPEGIIISDFGITIEKLEGDNGEENFFTFLAKWERLSFDKTKLTFYKSIKKLPKEYSLLRRVIDFANRLQRIESIYFFFREHPTSINLRTEHFVYIKSDKGKISKRVIKQIENEIVKDWKRAVSDALGEQQRLKLIAKDKKEEELHYRFELEK
jgi:hypothetical protein